MELSSSLSLHFPTIPSPKLSSSSFLRHLPTTTTTTTRSALNVRTFPARRKGFRCNSLFGLGVPELAVIAGVSVLLFGPKQIPELGRSIGKTVRGFQQAAKEFEAELKKPEDSEVADDAIDAKSVSDNSEEKENVGTSSSKES